jgi:2,4-dienoyl-CoA reductase-like NADH-dependent reductase (Old Yellow Enzyme family)
MLTCLADLFGEVTVGPVRFRNRIAMAPMGQHVSAADGRATPWHFVHYGSRAAGGCGFIMFEDTAVAADGRVSEGALGLYEDAQVDGLRQITRFCSEQGARTGIQLSHAGPKAFRDTLGHGHELVAATTEPNADGWASPRALDEHELKGIVAGFAAAVTRAVAAGFDAIEIHGTHGYLIHDLLSPLRNRRRDGLGGGLDNRLRLLIEVVRAARGVCPDDRLLCVRLPAWDGHVDGLGPADVAAIGARCAAEGVGLIALAGTLPSTGAVAGLDDYAATAGGLRAAGVEHLMYSAGLTTVDGATQLVSPLDATLVSVGRPLLLDPYWPIHLGRQCGAAVDIPCPYQGAGA